MVGCIVPWNYPLLLLAWKLAPALAAGNTTVCKPSELTPLSTLMLAPCFDHLPAGVVNLIAGAGDVGEAIVRRRARRLRRVHRLGRDRQARGGRVRAARRARRTSRWAARTRSSCAPTSPTRSTVAAKGGAWAAYLNAGQVCTSAERFYVMRDVYDDYVREFVDYTETLVLGDPLDPQHRHRPDGVGAAAREGRGPGRARGRAPARSCVTGGPDTGRERGHFFSPAVVTGRAGSTPSCCARRPSARSRRSCRCRASTRRSSSRTRPATGSAANVYTRDLKNVVRCMREIKAGTVWFNDPLTDNDAGPFGGMKQSGIGRELGEEGLEAFQETKHVHIETEIAPKEWWYPYAGGADVPPHGA